MDRLGKHLLARPRLPINHDRQIAGGHHLNIIPGLLHLFIHCDDVLLRKNRRILPVQPLRPVQRKHQIL